MTKNCLIFNDKPFVVKWARDCHEDSKNEVLRELENYQKAVEDGVEFFFPKTAFLFELDGIKFVVQEKIDFCHDDLYKYDIYRARYERISKTVPMRVIDGFRKSVDGSRLTQKLWIALAISLYGKKDCQRLAKFISDNNINDLHCANVGYKNNRPIILDFSGYHGW